ncbi:MAG: hypothetical protein HY646_18855 [Acidobacteria bacterium]|nr:hypothetical protein [Acidobacteriota bacterium]
MPRLGAREVIVTCPAPKKILGGGGSSNNRNLLITHNEVYDGAATQWHVVVQNTVNVGQDGFVTAQAICANVQ